MIKRIGIIAGVLTVIIVLLMLFAFDIIKINFIGFMEIQPSFHAMEKPLEVPGRSIPIEGAAYIPGLGAPDNPIEADEISIERGRVLFSVNCSHCHGPNGEGNGPIAPFLVNKKPANLTSQVTQDKSDGTLFLTLSTGIPGAMPALNENLDIRDRWDVVNYLRTLPPSR